MCRFNLSLGMQVQYLSASSLVFSFLISIAGFSQTPNRSAGIQLKDTQGYYRSFDSTRIYFESHGQGNPVVLFHGFTANGESWKRTPFYAALLQAGFRVINMDLRGNGRSDKPHNAEAYAHDAEARDIIGLLNALSVRAYQVAGYSRGSIITARLLVLDPRIVRAILGGMGADFTNPDWPRRIQFFHALSGDSVPGLEAMVRHVREAGLDQQALALMQKEQPSTSRQELASIRQPVLVLCGDKDSDNGSSQELTSLIPHAVHANVPGDHGAAVSTPEFAEKAVSFFEGKPPAP